MKTLAENLPTRNDSRQQATEPSKKSCDPKDSAKRISQMRSLVSQSFEIFNVYGKQPEAVTSIVQGFCLTLEDQEMADINRAFKVWMQERSAMPTPADIRQLTLSYAKNRREAREAQIARPAPRVDRAPDAVSWASKHWSQFTDADKNGLKAHLRTIDSAERAAGYRKYLIQFCGVPREFFD